MDAPLPSNGNASTWAAAFSALAGALGLAAKKVVDPMNARSKKAIALAEAAMEVARESSKKVEVLEARFMPAEEMRAEFNRVNDSVAKLGERTQDSLSKLHERVDRHIEGHGIQ